MPDFSDLVEARAQKTRLRADVLGKRRSMSAQARTVANQRIVSETRAFLRTVSAVRVAAYQPYATEPGGTELPEAIASTGATVLLPVLRPDRDLDWQAGGGPLLGVDAVAEADVVIVPAVAVDRRGIRLGRGGGSYDRALARVPATRPVVALIYDGELVDQLPAEDHDQRVHAVITPELGLVALRRSPGGS